MYETCYPICIDDSSIYFMSDGLLFDIYTGRSRNKSSNHNYDNVREIHATRLGLTSVPSEIYLCKNIECLKLDFNNIRDIDLAPFKCLKTLSISYNNLESIRFYNTMELLNISYNNLRHLELMSNDDKVASVLFAPLALSANSHEIMYHLRHGYQIKDNVKYQYGEAKGNSYFTAYVEERYQREPPRPLDLL